MYRTIKRVHRLAGIIGIIPIFMMAITGILLNHPSLIGYNSETTMKLQKFVYAIHSGTLGGISIVWITDLSAICMLILSVTGLWMVIKTTKIKRNKGRKRS
jgi:hypothetical protein